MFCSEQFARLLERLTGYQCQSSVSEVRRFRPGLDYTVGHYGALLLPDEHKLDLSLCFVHGKPGADGGDDEEDEGDGKVDVWEGGEVGGFEAYVAIDKKSEGDDVEYYVDKKEDEEEELLSISASTNTLNLIKRRRNQMHFVKYVSAAAPGSRWDVAVEYAAVPEIEQPFAEEQTVGEGAGEEEDYEGENVEGDEGKSEAEIVD